MTSIPRRWRQITCARATWLCGGIWRAPRCASRRYLAKHYHVLPLDQCLDQRPTAAYRAVVAFDDGYASVYHLAYPVLRALRLPATVFVPTDFIETRGLMWWDRLRQAFRSSLFQRVACADRALREGAKRLRLVQQFHAGWQHVRGWLGSRASTR
ncbi:MAG: polysaccharide deacetylase family protein [Deltaproteobacteria bacterium]|nr:polysaccharide deacetylase family protein [Deltaproteobacteria bacterium]